MRGAWRNEDQPLGDWAPGSKASEATNVPADLTPRTAAAGGFVAHCAEWPADRAIFEDDVLEPMFEEAFREAFAHGGIGALDDMWGFPDW